MTTGPEDDNMGGRAQDQPNPYPGSAPQHGSPQYGNPQYGNPQYGNPQQPYGGQQQPYGNPQQPYGGQQQPYPAGMNQMSSGSGRPGDLGSRFGARILDGLIVGVPSVIVVVLFTILGEATGSFGAWIFGVLAAVLYLAAFMGYFGWMEASKGQTLGKQILKLRTEGPNGGNPTMEQALKRNAFYLIPLGGYLISAVLSIGVLVILSFIVSVLAGFAGLAVVILIAVTINSNPAKQGKHDEFAGGTRVVTTQ